MIKKRIIFIILLGVNSFGNVFAWEDAPSVTGVCQNCDDEDDSGGGGYVSVGDVSAGTDEDARFKQEMIRKQEAYNFNQQGVVYAGQGNWEMALYYYKKAHEMYPEDQVIKNNYYAVNGYLLNEKGNRYYEQGDWSAALEYYRQAVEFRPTDAQTRLNLSNAQDMLQRQAEEQARIQLQLERGAQAAYRAAESSRKIKEIVDNLSDRLTPFEHTRPENPVLEPMAAYPVRGSAAAGGQARSAQSHGQKAMEKFSKESASEEARKVFDTPGEAKESLEPFKLRGMPLEYSDPVVAPEERNEVISGFEQTRDQVREKRKALEERLVELENAQDSGPVAVAKTKQAITNNRNKEYFYNFKITRELEKARAARSSQAPGENHK